MTGNEPFNLSADSDAAPAAAAAATSTLSGMMVVATRSEQVMNSCPSVALCLLDGWIGRNGNIRNHIVCRNANTFRSFYDVQFYFQQRPRHHQFYKNTILMRTSIKMIKFMAD